MRNAEVLPPSSRGGANGPGAAEVNRQHRHFRVWCLDSWCRPGRRVGGASAPPPGVGGEAVGWTRIALPRSASRGTQGGGACVSASGSVPSSPRLPPLRIAQTARTSPSLPPNLLPSARIHEWRV